MNTAALGDLVRRRRRELLITQLDAAAAGGPSNATLTSIERGDQVAVNISTLRKLERALKWQPDSLIAFLDEGTPPHDLAELPPQNSPPNPSELVITIRNDLIAGLDVDARSRIELAAVMAALQALDQATAR